MINTLVRLADAADHQQLSNLVFFETRLHRHLDWRSPLDWLGNPFYWALDEGKRISAALACPIETEGIAWIRLFAYRDGWSAENAWTVLWSVAKEEIAHAGGATVAAIAMQPWFQTVLAASGFENRQGIVMLEWKYQPWVKRESNGVRIRTMMEADLFAIENVDAASFNRLWHNSFATLQRAFTQSLIATVAEDENGVVAYQLTTGSAQRAHLARLAVRQGAQGRGVGKLLLSDLFARMSALGIVRLSVNTQSDNLSSLRLYQSMGFVLTGEQYPVFTFDVPAYV
jgi:ribosomal-protein-alanine N-acetyltransferase